MAWGSLPGLCACILQLAASLVKHPTLTLHLNPQSRQCFLALAGERGHVPAGRRGWVGLRPCPGLVRAYCVSMYRRERLARLSFLAAYRLEAPYKNIWHYSQMFHFSKTSCTHRALGAQKTAVLPSSLPALKPAVGDFSALLFHAAAQGEESNCKFRWLWEVSFFNGFQSPFQCRARGARSMPPAPWLPLGPLTILLVCHALQSLRGDLSLQHVISNWRQAVMLQLS